MLVPTRELAQQVTDEFRLVAEPKGLRIAPVYGGVPFKSQAAKAREAHVVVATPGRLEDLAQRRLLGLDRIRILVLDEADRMLDMGFKPQVDRIVKRVPRNRQTMFFSATSTARWACSRARIRRAPPASRPIAGRPSRRGDRAPVRFVDPNTKVETLVEHLEASTGLTLVFVRTKRGADRLVKRLDRHGVKADSLHGDMRQSARRRALDRFESGKVSVLVATDAARGLDIDDVENVINFDPPEEDKGTSTAPAERAGPGGAASR